VSADTFPGLAAIAQDVHAGRPVAVATVVDHPDTAVVGRRLMVRPQQSGMSVPSDLGHSSFGAPAAGRIVDSLIADARCLLAAGRSECLSYRSQRGPRSEELRIFIQSFVPPARMLVFGATDYAAAVARIGSFLGYRVTVCDARPLFATHDRFPDAADVVVDWPHRYLQAELQAGRIDDRTAICVLTHDPKFDVPLLDLALTMPFAGYVGAMGSRRTHENRLAQLADQGLTRAELSRLSRPRSSPSGTAAAACASLVPASPFITS
jgi:xanthine dehydrogenase accessory factor